jgi:glucosamine--fructose-6-phosphate aminotransferase (isomerizing)
MCGIVGAVAERNIVPILMEGLRRLEYRGYDSAGVAVLNGTDKLKRVRTVGKVQALQDAINQSPTHGKIGIAHTRWATHGVPSERNAHPHISDDGLAIVHNGIIENHEELRRDLERLGYKFTSETDTEVIAHRIHHHLQTVGDLFKAVRATVAELEGAYALAVVSEKDPTRIILAREGCPVVWVWVSMKISSPRMCLRCCRLRGASCSSKRVTSPTYAARPCASSIATATMPSARCARAN